jgi:hypothetical protein
VVLRLCSSRSSLQYASAKGALWGEQAPAGAAPVTKLSRVAIVSMVRCGQRELLEVKANRKLGVHAGKLAEAVSRR